MAHSYKAEQVSIPIKESDSLIHRFGNHVCFHLQDEVLS